MPHSSWTLAQAVVAEVYVAGLAGCARVSTSALVAGGLARQAGRREGEGGSWARGLAEVVVEICAYAVCAVGGIDADRAVRRTG